MPGRRWSDGLHQAIELHLIRHLSQWIVTGLIYMRALTRRILRITADRLPLGGAAQNPRFLCRDE
jgi:hypothetical protein